MIPIPSCAVVTATADGRVHRLADVDTIVRRGDVVAQIEGARGVMDLTAPVPGRVAGALADPRQAVTTGEGVLWLARA